MIDYTSITPRLKLVATPEQFELFLTRNVPWPPTPEIRLVVAVLAQAARDALDCYKNYLSSFTRKRRVKGAPKAAPKKVQPMTIEALLNDEAVAFWFDGRAGDFAQLIGLDAEFVKEQFIKHLGIDVDALLNMREEDREARFILSVTAMYAEHDALQASLS
jgi:hypothetical protein